MSVEVSNLDYLGLVAGIIDEIGIENRKYSTGYDIISCLIKARSRGARCSHYLNRVC